MKKAQYRIRMTFYRNGASPVDRPGLQWTLGADRQDLVWPSYLGGAQTPTGTAAGLPVQRYRPALDADSRWGLEWCTPATTPAFVLRKKARGARRPRLTLVGSDEVE